MALFIRSALIKMKTSTVRIVPDDNGVHIASSNGGEVSVELDHLSDFIMSLQAIRRDIGKLDETAEELKPEKTEAA